MRAPKTPGEGPPAEEVKVLSSVEQLRELFRLTETADHIEKAIEILSRDEAELGTEPVSEETISEIRRVEEALSEYIAASSAKMPPEMAEKFSALSEIRANSKQDAEERFAEFLEKQNQTDWFESLEERLEKRKEMSLEGLPLDKKEGITPAEIQEHLKLQDDSNHLQHTYNHLRRLHEVLGIEPLTPEAEKDISRVWGDVIRQMNVLNGRATGEQRQALSSLGEAKWGARRITNGNFAEAFEQEIGEPLYEPLPEPEVPVRVPEKKERKVHTRKCPGCGKEFKSTLEEGPCYDCALESITHGMPPEEGDFNTAAIISGTLTEEEEKYLREDLESVETV